MSYPVRPRRRRWQSPDESYSGSWQRLWNCSEAFDVWCRAPPGCHTLPGVGGRGQEPPQLPCLQTDPPWEPRLWHLHTKKKKKKSGLSKTIQDFSPIYFRSSCELNLNKQLFYDSWRSLLTRVWLSHLFLFVQMMKIWIYGKSQRKC